MAIDYIYRCTLYGCSVADSTTKGYWISNFNTSQAWAVVYTGALDFSIAINTYGIRQL